MPTPRYAQLFRPIRALFGGNDYSYRSSLTRRDRRRRKYTPCWEGGLERRDVPASYISGTFRSFYSGFAAPDYGTGKAAPVSGYIFVRKDCLARE
jgi:hypothetical protein